MKGFKKTFYKLQKFTTYMISAESADLLEDGKSYEVSHVEVNDWYTVVYLVDFPGVSFNSCWFDEIGKMNQDYEKQQISSDK